MRVPLLNFEGGPRVPLLHRAIQGLQQRHQNDVIWHCDVFIDDFEQLQRSIQDINTVFFLTLTFIFPPDCTFSVKEAESLLMID